MLTVPHELNRLIAANPGPLLRLLSGCSRDANLQVAAECYGVLPGLVQVLHTWGQFLLFHYHVHTILTAGGLAVDQRGKVILSDPRWIEIDPDDAQSRKAEWAATFMRLFLKGLRKLCQRGELRLPTSLADEAALDELLEKVEGKDWIADVQGTPPEHRGQKESQHVFGYLAKYFGGVAILAIAQWMIAWRNEKIPAAEAWTPTLAVLRRILAVKVARGSRNPVAISLTRELSGASSFESPVQHQEGEPRSGERQ